MPAKDQGSKRQHPIHDKKAMPGSAAAKSSVTKAKPAPRPPMLTRGGPTAGRG